HAPTSVLHSFPTRRSSDLGAKQKGGQSIGFSITLPKEQQINPYVPQELAFEFHYFFMRKFWFVYLAKALVIFPGGFGTMDERLGDRKSTRLNSSHEWISYA